MLLSRHPFAERSGRATILRQRIDQARRHFEPRLVVFGAPAGDKSDEGMTFLPLANPLSIALNAVRLHDRPLQTWLFYAKSAREEVARMREACAAEAVFVDMLRLAPLTYGMPREIALIIDYDDLLSQRYAQAARKDYEVMGFLSRRVGPLANVARTFARPILLNESKRCAAYEAAWLERADLALFTSPLEAASIGRSNPNTMPAPPLAPVAHASDGTPGDRLIFLGNMHYAENVLMLRALHAALAGFSEAMRTAAVIDVIGDCPPELRHELEGANFRFLGRVDDLSTLDGAGVFLAPVVGGSGVKLKVLDGLALGCPVVTTEKGCEGLAVRRNRDLLVARDPAGVLAAALALRGRDALKHALARNGRAYAERWHGPRLGAAIADAMAAAVKRRQETL